MRGPIEGSFCIYIYFSIPVEPLLKDFPKQLISKLLCNICRVTPFPLFPIFVRFQRKNEEMSVFYSFIYL